MDIDRSCTETRVGLCENETKIPPWSVETSFHGLILSTNEHYPSVMEFRPRPNLANGVQNGWRDGRLTDLNQSADAFNLPYDHVSFLYLQQYILFCESF